MMVVVVVNVVAVVVTVVVVYSFSLITDDFYLFGVRALRNLIQWRVKDRRSQELLMIRVMTKKKNMSWTSG